MRYCTEKSSCERANLRAETTFTPAAVVGTRMAKYTTMELEPVTDAAVVIRTADAFNGKP